MNLPANDLTAEYVRDQVQVEEQARDRSWHPGYVPGPDLAGTCSLKAGRAFAPNGRPCAATVMLLPALAQDVVKAGFRSQISTLVRQFWHDLAGREAGKFHQITDVQHGGAFIRAQLVGRFRTQHEGPLIRLHLSVFAPAAQGAVADLQLDTGFGAWRASRDSLFDQSDSGLESRPSRRPL